MTTTPRNPQDQCPYKFLDYFTRDDADVFFGREEETMRLTGEILSSRLLVLFSPSGSGKTSLINAGLRPRLERLDCDTAYVRLEGDPLSSIQRLLAEAFGLPKSADANLFELVGHITRRRSRSLVVFVDQFEELFIVLKDKPAQRRAFIEQLAAIYFQDDLPVTFVLSLREDYFGSLHEFAEILPAIFHRHASVRLRPFDDAQATRAIEEPARLRGCQVEPGLTAELLRDLREPGGGIEPIKLQVVCYELWQDADRPRDTLDLATYERLERAESILGALVGRQLSGVSWWKGWLLARVLASLITPARTKVFRSREEIEMWCGSRWNVWTGSILEALESRRLVRREERVGSQWFELRHDFLALQISHWLEARSARITKRMRTALSIGAVMVVGLGLWLFHELTTWKLAFMPREYDAQSEQVGLRRSLWFFPDWIETDFSRASFRSGDVGTANAILAGWPQRAQPPTSWDRFFVRLSRQEMIRNLYAVGLLGRAADSLLNVISLRGDGGGDAPFWDVSYEWLPYLPRFDSLKTLLRERFEAREDTAGVRKLDGFLGEIEPPVGGARVLGDTTRYRDAEATVTERLDSDVTLRNAARLLHNTYLPVRVAAASILARRGIRRTELLPILRSGIDDSDWWTRYDAACGLAALGEHESVMIGPLLQAFVVASMGKASLNVDEISSTVTALVAADSGSAVALHSQLLRGGMEARVAARLLHDVGLADSATVLSLVGGLGAPQEWIRSNCLHGLDEPGGNSTTVVERLLDMLERPPKSASSGDLPDTSGKGYLRAIGFKDRSETGESEWLADFPEDEDVLVAALEVHQPSAPTQISRLLRLAAQGDEWQRRAALRVLIALPTFPPSAIDSVIDLARSSSAEARMYCALGLGRCKTLSNSQLAVLSSLCKDGSSRVAVAAVLSRAEIARWNSEATLLRELESRRVAERRSAAKALALRPDLSSTSALRLETILREAKTTWARRAALQVLVDRAELRRSASEAHADSAYLDSLIMVGSSASPTGSNVMSCRLYARTGRLQIAIGILTRSSSRMALVRELEGDSVASAALSKSWYFRELMRRESRSSGVRETKHAVSVPGVRRQGGIARQSTRQVATH